MQEALKAVDKLSELGYAVNIWSITSFNELYRDAVASERSQLFGEDIEAYITSLFAEEDGVFVAATDYMKALPDCVAKWMPQPYITLGTDGYGVCESRPDLRDYFEVSCDYIVLAALRGLLQDGRIDEASFVQSSQSLQVAQNKNYVQH